MTSSMSLLTAQITFLEPQLVLVHIPVNQYSLFLQPILRLLFGDDHDEEAARIPWTNRHDFFNLSVTPLECSIICSKHLAEKYIVPVQETLQALFQPKGVGGNQVTIFQEIYIVIQVDGQGLDAGQRVLELTGPLAMAGISIFFITTYFCDYILVPARARRIVTVTLEQRGFVFSKDEHAFISQLSPSTTQKHSRNISSSSEELSSPTGHRSSPSVPSTPPVKDLDELQLRTFRKLKQHNVHPLANDSLRLVSCAGSREPDLKKDARLKDDLLQVLISTSMRTDNVTETADHPGEECRAWLDASTSFLSITITAVEPISVLLEARLLPRLGESLYGAKDEDDILIPISFDLSHLAFETTGIIGGVASRLSQGKTGREGYIDDTDLSPNMVPVDKDENGNGMEISFLSTARAGTVIVKASQLTRAMARLDQALEETLIEAV